MLNERSLKNLVGVNEKLVRLVHKVAETETFIVNEGLRSLERQQQLFKEGRTKTLQSKHLVGRAVDLYPVVDGKVVVSDWAPFIRLANAVKTAAKELGITIVWGGDWKSFRDGPHYELGESE